MFKVRFCTNYLLAPDISDRLSDFLLDILNVTINFWLQIKYGVFSYFPYLEKNELIATVNK